MANGTQGPQDDTNKGVKQLLRQRVRTWTRLTDQIREIREWMTAPIATRGPQPADLERFNEYRELRKEEADNIFSTLKTHHNLADEAAKWGFTHDSFDPEDYTGAGPTPDAAQGGAESQPSGNGSQGPQSGGGNQGGWDGSGGSGASGQGGNGRGGGGGGNNEPIDHLPGKEGKDYHFVKGPGGTVKVVYAMDIPGPKKGSIAFTVPKELYDRYNVDPDKVKQLTKAQMKNLQGFGSINEIKLRRGEHPFQSWLNTMKRKFGTAPGMLRDKEVMQTLYAAHLSNWDATELKGALQQTKWYDTKRTERIDWLFSSTSADKKTRLNSYVNNLTDYVRQQFGGVDWTAHGINDAKIKEWAHNVASGRTGWEVDEAKTRIDEIARGIEGTALWASEESSSQSGLEESQEWEDIFERFRSKNIEWLGPNGRSSQEVLTSWAKKRASGEVVDADYDQFLREQRTNLYPYITGDRSWQEFADPYKAALQRVMGDNASIDWNHELLADLGSKDNNGVATGTAMSLYDFNQLARDPDKNAAAYNRGTALYDQGMDRLGGLLADLRGAA